MKGFASATLLAVLLSAAPFPANGQTAAAPAPVLAAPVPTGEALAMQNRLNREFYTRLLQGPDGTPGEWLSESFDSKIIYTPSGEDGFTRQRFSVHPDRSSTLKDSADFRFDESTGTVVRYQDGVAAQWIRVARKDRDYGVDVYTVESLPDSVYSAAQSRAFGATYLLVGNLMTISRPDASEKYAWSPPERAKAPLATAESIASTPPERIARWGAIAALTRTGVVTYDVASRTLNTTMVGYNDWIVPGESVRVSWSAGDNRTSAGEMHWNEALGRIDIFDRAGRASGHATVASDGSVRFTSEGSVSQLHARADGSLQNDWTIASLGTGQTLHFPNTLAGLQLAYQTQRQAQKAAEDAATAAREERRAEERAKTDSFLAAMTGIQQGMAQFEQDWDASRARLDSADEPSAYASSEPTIDEAPVESDAAPPPGGELRFVLSIGLQPRAGDSTNPTCYSDVIARPGPPGWGQRGFLPPGSAEEAHATVQELKSAFIAACRAASGRDVTSEGDFHWTWNETADGESQIADTRARYPEDVTVGL